MLHNTIHSVHIQHHLFCYYYYFFFSSSLFQVFAIVHVLFRIDIPIRGSAEENMRIGERKGWMEKKNKTKKKKELHGDELSMRLWEDELFDKSNGR